MENGLAEISVLMTKTAAEVSRFLLSSFHMLLFSSLWQPMGKHLSTVAVACTLSSSKACAGILLPWEQYSSCLGHRAPPSREISTAAEGQFGLSSTLQYSKKALPSEPQCRPAFPASRILSDEFLVSKSPCFLVSITQWIKAAAPTPETFHFLSLEFISHLCSIFFLITVFLVYKESPG